MKYLDITLENNKRYLYYHCDKCKKWHLVITNIGRKLRNKFKDVGELILWCGIGKKPKLLTDNKDICSICQSKRIWDKDNLCFRCQCEGDKLIGVDIKDSNPGQPDTERTTGRVGVG